MNWTFSTDSTSPVLTAEKHALSGHGASERVILPETCVIFEIGMALNHILETCETRVLMKNLPCFLEDSMCVSISGHDAVCFTRGGYGAPAAVDTLETVRALGVKRVIVAGMCGGFGKNTRVCDVIIPRKILCEEGASFHYYEDIEYAHPDKSLHAVAADFFSGKFNTVTDPTVTTDAIYRQTFFKEALWRERGAVGVDMESSAILSVAAKYNMPAVSILLTSDKHPMTESDAPWDWGNINFGETRKRFVSAVVDFAVNLGGI